MVRLPRPVGVFIALFVFVVLGGLSGAGLAQGQGVPPEPAPGPTAVAGPPEVATELPTELKALFVYDTAAPLNAVSVQTAETLQAVEERIEFDSPGGGRVAGLLIRPKTVQRPPVILFLHGLGGSKNDARLAAPLAVQYGYAVLGLDAALHGDRRMAGQEMFSPDLMRIKLAFIQTVVDYRRALDYLATREDVKADKVGLVGASMGAILGTIVTAVEPRVATALLLVGGGDWKKFVQASQHPAAAALLPVFEMPEVARELATLDPVTYAPYISPRPVWLVNGRQDEIVPALAADALHQACREPKKVVWYDGGHLPPLPVLLQVVPQWMNEVLAPALAAGGQADQAQADGPQPGPVGATAAAP
ncbi:MAG: alpha/beta fold hydrolase [Armatimonadetes bacterium]|nr:alpha/beta fold hydrolase [Armatimonadota bacterium]